MDVEIIDIGTKESQTVENVLEADLTKRDVNGRFEELVVEVVYEDETEKTFYNSFIYGASLTDEEIWDLQQG